MEARIAKYDFNAHEGKQEGRANRRTRKQYNRSIRRFKVKLEKLRWSLKNFRMKWHHTEAKKIFAKVDSLKKALFLLALPRYLLATVGDMANKFTSFNFNLSPTTSYPPFVFAGSY